MGMKNRAPQYPAQDVPAAIVARRDSIGYQKCGCTNMFGNNTDRFLAARRLAMIDVVELLDALDDGREQVGVVDGGALRIVGPGVALKQGRFGHALQAGTGIDVLLGQRRALLAVAVVGHEHQVPYLQEASTLNGWVTGLRGAFGTTRLRAEVIVQLGAGAAGADVAGEPVVLLLAVAADALPREEAATEAERLLGGQVE